MSRGATSIVDGSRPVRAAPSANQVRYCAAIAGVMLRAPTSAMSASSPASRITCGLRVPIEIGTGCTGPTMRAASTVIVSPCTVTSSPRNNPAIAVTASRSVATGRGDDMPTCSSPAPTPIPRNIRPCDASCNAAIAPASTAGWREYGLVTIGPSMIRSVRWLINAIST